MKWSYKSMNQNWRAIEIATYYLWTWLEKVTRICENVTVFISTNIDYLFDEIYSYFLSKVLFLVRICQKYFCKVSLIEVKLKSAKYMLWKKWYMKIDYFCISNLWSTGCTVWKFGNFSENQILREFNFWSVKICDLTVSVPLSRT